ncbi:hypothetical protein T265_09253 [Opisthorchis viverrini]|uniref:Nucleoporin Nup133/Nup155-like N-terminal domain-containing protein n=1 Tax=Opisthorchis viverrini TaxID=6198 RepID=A0A074Z6L1_OPIVI|nr:hypothetical protein T265_09253 [Opisthorchis viverrini]KER22698.1 hypothetical protein T265_09253 [Opisthorchis viverrini]
MMKQDTHRLLHGCVTVDLEPSRMLQVSRLCTSLPVFASEALRTCSSELYSLFTSQPFALKLQVSAFCPVGGSLSSRGANCFYGSIQVHLNHKQLTGSPLPFTSKTQDYMNSHSTCLTFTLPASDMPHSALLVAPIFPSPIGLRSGSHPTGCLALSSCGEILRIWPRLARNSLHVDVNLSASTTGLYGDEAIQLEPTSVHGTFVLATRTGHLILVDPRNAPDGVRCRLLTGRTKTDPGAGTHGSASLLSGLSRRVSNLFGLVASSGGFGMRLNPARGGGNMVFVRLVTRPIGGTSMDDAACRVYMLMESQLDVWSIDQNLDERMLGVYSIQSLLQSSIHDSLLGQWHAVDMAVQHSTESNLSDDLLYLLVSNAASGPSGVGLFHLVTLDVGNEDQPEGQVLQVIPTAAVQVDWPFELSAMRSTSFRHKMIHLCLPASLAPDFSGNPLYPCLLACLFSPFTGQVTIIEVCPKLLPTLFNDPCFLLYPFKVLTGHSIARMEFGALGTTPAPPICPSALIGCGSVDSSNLFVYVTCQRGLITLTPANDMLPPSTASGGGVSASQSIAELSHSAIHDVTKASTKLRASNVSVDSVASNESQRARTDRNPVVIVYTMDGVKQVVAQLTPSGLSVWDPNDTTRSPVQLSPADLCFVGVGEIARVYWMGYQQYFGIHTTCPYRIYCTCCFKKEQAAKCVIRLVEEERLRTELSCAFLRFTSRLMNERPLSDARWRSLTLPAYSEQESLMPEGCSVFQYVISRFTSEAPLLSVSRLQTKLDSIKRLRELWSILPSSDLFPVSDAFVPLTELNCWLRIRLPSRTSIVDPELSDSLQNDDQMESNRRWYVGERPGVLSDEGVGTTTDSSRFHCMLADDNNEVEACAERLLRSLDESRMLQAAEDNSMDHSGRPASVHIVCGMHLAEELVEFARIVQTKLAQNPQAMLQRIFQSVAVQAGFSSTALQVVNPQEAILQTNAPVAASLPLSVCSFVIVIANLRYLWRRRDISFSVKGRVYNAAVRSILLYGSETWPLRAEDVKRLSVFDHRCLRSIARIWWEHRISNSEVSLVPNLVAGLGEAILQAVHPGESNMSMESDDERASSSTLVSVSVTNLFVSVMELLTPALSAVLGYRDRQLPSLYEAVKGFSTGRSHYLVCWLTDCRPYGIGDVLLDLPALSAVLGYRDRQLPSLYEAVKGFSTGRSHYLVCWLTDCRPYGIGDVLLDLFDLLIRFGCGEVAVVVDQQNATGGTMISDSSQLIKDASSWAVEWASVLLGVAHQRVRWATAHSTWIWSHPPLNDQSAGPSIMERVESIQRLRRMRSWFVQLRKYIIDSVADKLNRPEAALHLAERFADCAQMVRLCYLLERQDEIDHASEDCEPVSTTQLTRFHHHRLVELLRRVPESYGLADQALQWYFACEEHARVKSLLALLERLKEKSTSTEDQFHSLAKTRAPQHTAPPSAVEQRRKVATETDPVNRFLHRQDTRDHAWPHLLSTRQYSKASAFSGQHVSNPFLLLICSTPSPITSHPNPFYSTVQASQILFEEGCKETRSIGRRKVLLSLAKLTLLATGSVSKTRTTTGDLGVSGETVPDRLIEKLNLLLEAIDLQEQLPVELRAVYSARHAQSDRADPSYDPLLDLDSLARLYVSGATLSPAAPLFSRTTSPDSVVESPDAPLLKCGRDEFHAAFRLADLIVELADLQPGSQLVNPDEARHQLLVHIWCQALKMNDWTKTAEHEDPVDICSRSFVCSLVRDLSRTHAKALEVLFTPDELFDHPDLADLSGDPRFRYLIQSGLEYMQSLFI